MCELCNSGLLVVTDGVCAVQHKWGGAVLGNESWLCEGVEKGWVQQKILIFLFCFSQLGDRVAVNIQFKYCRFTLLSHKGQITNVTDVMLCRTLRKEKKVHAAP